MTAVPQRDAVMRWARELYAQSVDRKDAAGFAAAFTPDAWLRFANWEPIVGRAAIEAAIAQFFTAMIDLRHESTYTHLANGDTLVLEALVTYTRHDRAKVTVPACTIFHLVGADGDGRPLADECRIYVDLAPLFAPSA
jgi:ketosteroid isomerase-like protein